MDKQKIVGKRWMSALLALILMMTLLPAPSAAADDSPNGENAIQNPGFEKPSISQIFKYIPQQDVSAWETTAKEGMIEFGRNWGNQTAPHYTSTDKNNAEGDQFAELNAAEESTLYQNVTTVGGNVYEWGLQHRGRIGVDKMALIIGPTQEKAPSKPSKDGRDQYMQLTDWVHDNQEKLKFKIPDDGCSQRLTVYSKPFGENGTFLGGSGSESPFSTEVSNIYTERWDVWIIATDNQHWVGYGIKDNAYQGNNGVGGGLSYECSYLVPDGQTQTTFAFCSYSSTPPAGAQVSKTYGNLIDDLQFSLYHTVTISATPGSSKIMASTKINGNKQELDFSKNGGSIVVRNNNDLTLTVWEDKNALNNGLETEFAGALVIGPNGSRFYPVGDPNMWKKVEKPDESGQKHYGFTLNVSDPVSIRLIFVQSPAVTYFANGGTYKAEDGNTSGVVSFKETVDASGEQHKRDPYTSHAATGPDDGWRFDGWLSVRDKLLLPAKHTVSYNYDSANPAFTFKIDGKNEKFVPHSGVTLVAQWSYRQRAQVQLRGEDGKFTNSIKAGTVTIRSAAETNDAAVGSGSAACYAKTGATVTAKAKANDGYYFLGWAVEGSDKDEYVSTHLTYTYRVSGQETRTVYARFAKQYAVTYKWAEDPNWSLTGDKQPALPSPNIVLQGDSYAISTKYRKGDSIEDTVNSVPGHWVFNGWKDQDAPDVDLTGSIPNVNRDYVLVGYWTWVQNSKYQLSYFGGDNQTCWIPTEMSKVPDSSSHYQDSNVTVAGALTTTRDKVMLSGKLELEGTWSFTGWKRSDTDKIVPAEQSITMPGYDLTLTAQWKFTPKTYTVQYNLAGGTGRAPDGHTVFGYTPYVDSKTGVVEKGGIPFGADITLRDFGGTPPDNTYFAGWSLTDPRPVEDKDSIDTYGAGAVVNSTMLGVTEDDKKVTLYAVYRSIGKITVEFDVNDPSMGSVTTQSGVFTVVDGSVTGDPLTSVATAKPGYHFTGWTVEVGPDEDNDSFVPLNNASLTIASTNFDAADAGNRFVFQAQFAPIDPVKPGGDDSKDSYYFAIAKIDAQDSHALNGATFALYQYSSDGKTVNRTTATTSRNGSESGIALFSVDNKNSYEGIWYYAEVTAPEGYVLDSTEHKITKNDFSTSQSAAIRNAETVRNYRSSTPNMLNDTDHFAYVIGYKDGLVKPYGLITRAETTTIFFRLLKDSVRDSSLLTSSTYTDVPDNYWANTAISTMTGLGIVQGRSTTTFDPQSPITRAQFAAICARFDTGTSSGTQIFSDISGHWAEKYIQRAAELGWIKGFEDGTFRPDTYITRAQAMTMINRVLNRIPEEESDLLTGMNVWPDCNPGDWFYLAVQEATNSHAFKHKAGNYETWIGMSQNPDWTRYEN